MKVLSVALQKGGVGKSTTATAVAACLGNMGHKTLLVDMDMQANSTYISSPNEPEHTITDALVGDATVQEAIIPCAYYDLLPADQFLSNVEKADMPVNLLSSILAPIANNYDFCIIDTPPSLGTLLKASLISSDYVLIPIDARPLAIKGIDALQETLTAVQAVHPLKILGIVLTRYNDRSILNRQLKDVLTQRASDLGTSLFRTYIHDSVSVPESQAMQMPLLDYAPKAKPTLDYAALTGAILERM